MGKNKVAVVGIGQTHHQATRGDVSMGGLVREAALEALADAGMTWADIDAVERHHEAEGRAGEVVGAAGAREVDLRLVEPRVGLDLVQHRHEHLDLVALLLAAHVVGLGEGDDGDIAHH